MALPKAVQKIRDQLQRGKAPPFQVASGSMEPLIRTGETIEVAPLPIEEARKFDIIVFWDGSRLICHYLWHINRIREPDGSLTLVTRPLSGSGEDLPISENNVIGKVISHAVPLSTKVRLSFRAWLRSGRLGQLLRF